MDILDDTYDLVVVGGGPAGASAAWRGARLGLKTIVLDRATFPRDKPCGDGLTPRGVKLLIDMGLEAELERFHRIDGFRLVTRFGTREQRWAHSDVGLPDRAYVCRRTELDTLLLEHAREAGAYVADGVTAGGLLTERGRAAGVRARSNSGEVEVRGRVVIAADGATSRLAKAAGVAASSSGVVGYAARIELRCDRPDDHYMEVYPELMLNSQLIPAYGWVFPMGEGGVVNLGVGFVSTSMSWRDIRVPALIDELVAQLPGDWHVPDAEQLFAADGFAGWKLPMGITADPLWRPGFMVCGDAAGVAKPFTGAGISKAIQSGLLAAEFARATVADDDDRHLAEYQTTIRQLWGRSHTSGITFARSVGNPRVMSAFVRVLGSGAGSRAVHKAFSQAVKPARQPATELRA